jgi:putative sigma-54 modulation protein
MTMTYTAKNVKLTGAQKGFCEKQMESIAKLTGDVIEAEIIIAEEKLDYKIELLIKTKNNAYHISEQDPIMKQALREAFNTLKLQAKKQKEKLQGDKNRPAKKSTLKGMLPDEEELPDKEEAGKDILSQITITDNFHPKPLSVEEALFYLQESGDTAFMFQNQETKKISVIYFNRKKKVSIIESR